VIVGLYFSLVVLVGKGEGWVDGVLCCAVLCCDGQDLGGWGMRFEVV
jgi:hypothetical protein